MYKILIFSIALFLSSCGEGGNKEGVEKVDTGDVKGSIAVGEMELSKNLQLHNNEGTFKAIKVKDSEGNDFTIYPSKRSLDDIRNDMNKSSFSMGDEHEVLEDKKNLLVYKETSKKFGSDEMQEGYGFYLLIPADGGVVYLAESSGATPLDPILDKQKMEALLKVAKSFKPE